MISWVLYVIFLAAIGFIIFRHRFFHLPGLPKKATLVFFALKLIAGLAVWYVYTHYYPQREYADIWKYYDDSEVVYGALSENSGDYLKLMTGVGIDDRIQHTYIDNMMHWDQQFESNLFNDSHTIIRFNALLRIFSGGNYHTHSLLMCFLAFIGLCALYHWIYPYLFHWKKVVAFILFISPSLLFWSSGVLKEGLLFFSLGLLIYHTWKFRDDRKRIRLVWIIAATFLLAITKLYMLVFILPALGIALHLQKNPRFALAKVIALFASLIGIAFVIHLAKPSLSPFRIIAMKQHDFLNLARGGTYLMDSLHVVYLRPDQTVITSKEDGPDTYHIPPNTEIIYWNIADDFQDTLRRTVVVEEKYKLLSASPVAGSLMDVRILETTPVSVLAEAVPALGRSVFRPHPWEVKPIMIVPPMLENLLLYVLVFLMLIAGKKSSSKAIFWFCMVYAITALTVTGLTTPVLGALVRYRITAIPFLMFAVLLCIDKVKLGKRFPRLIGML